MSQPQPCASAEQVHAYWFGPIQGPHDLLQARGSLWFGSSAQQDQAIREGFGATLEAASLGRLDDWAQTPRGALSLIVVLDQLSRNIHRGLAQAFASDAKARQLALTLIDARQDRTLYPIERVFVYLPLEHSERMSDQLLCLKCMERLRDEADDEAAGHVLAGYVEYAWSHLRLIERFGRFPHRNAILGRPSTPEELAYLAQGGQTFGQVAKAP